MNNKSIANLSFIICVLMLINNIAALLFNLEIPKLTFNLSILLMLILFIYGMLHKKRASK